MTAPRQIKPSPFTTVADVARYLGVSKMTVYRLVHNGDLKSVQVGRSFRIKVSSVNEFVGENTRGAA